MAPKPKYQRQDMQKLTGKDYKRKGYTQEQAVRSSYGISWVWK